MKWTKQQDMKALLIYKKQRAKDIEILKAELANDDIFPENSFNTVNLKIGNIKFLDSNGKEGLSGYSEQCKAVYEEYKDTPIDQLTELVKKAS